MADKKPSDCAKHLRGCADALRHGDKQSALTHLSACIDDCDDHCDDDCADVKAKVAACKNATDATPKKGADAARDASRTQCADQLDALAAEAEAGKVDWKGLFAKVVAALPTILAIFGL